MKTFINISALRANTCIGKKVFVQGYDSIGDGGQGIFYWDNNNEADDDDGVTIKVDNIEKGRWKRVFDSAVNVKWFGAAGDGVNNDSEAIQNAVNSNSYVFFPKGIYKITTSISLKSQSHIYGIVASGSIIYAYGCNAFEINGLQGDNIIIEKMQIRSFSNIGEADPKTYVGINAKGLESNHVNYLIIRDVFILGFLYCIDFQFTWNSLIDNVDTSNCENAVRLLGRSVNNSINNSRLGANSGNASIYAKQDDVYVGEGLMVSNSLLAGGDYGILITGSFLFMSVTNCIIDLIQNIGVLATDGKCTVITNCWIFAVNRGIEFSPVSQLINENLSVNNCRIQTTGISGIGIFIREGNKGITISGGSIECADGGRCIRTYYAESIVIANLFLINPSLTVESILLETTPDAITNALVGNSSILVI